LTEKSQKNYIFIAILLEDMLTSHERHTGMEELACPPSIPNKGTYAVHYILKRNLTFIQGSSLGLTIDIASI
jgi:hypothetical protein